MKKALPILAGLMTFIVVFFGLYSILDSVNSERPGFNENSLYVWGSVILVLIVLFVILYLVSTKESQTKDNFESTPDRKIKFDDQFISDILEAINFHTVVFRNNQFIKALYYEKLVHVKYTLKIIEDRLYLGDEKELLECVVRYHYNLNKLTSNLDEVDYDKYITLLGNINKEILEILKNSKTTSHTKV